MTTSPANHSPHRIGSPALRIFSSRPSEAGTVDSPQSQPGIHYLARKGSPVAFGVASMLFATLAINPAKAGGTPAGVNNVQDLSFQGNNNNVVSSGSFFYWDLNANSNTDRTLYDTVSPNGNSAYAISTDAEFRVILMAGVDLTDPFWDTPATWTDIFVISGSTTITGTFTPGPVSVYQTNGTTLRDISSVGSFAIGGTGVGTTLSFTPIPEPTTALAGMLLAAGMLRRKRKG